MRENARAKAARLLVEGRIEIVRLDEHGCLALVRGDSGEIRTVQVLPRCLDLRLPRTRILQPCDGLRPGRGGAGCLGTDAGPALSR